MATLESVENSNFPGFLDASESNASACNAGDLGSSPGSGRSHSSILAFRIPWIEGPGRLQSMGLKRVHGFVKNPVGLSD